MFDFLLNPLILFLVSIPVFLFTGIILGTYLSKPRQNRVLKLSPESGRGINFAVDSEDTVNLYCKPVGNIDPHRFVRLNAAYTIIQKGFMKINSYALWLGRQGTAYTFRLLDETVKLTLKQTVHSIFGDKYYNQIPKEMREQIEKGDIGVTVEFPKVPLTPEGMESLSESDIERTSLDKLIESLAKGVANMSKTSEAAWGKIIFYIGTGIAIGIIASLVFGWGAPVVIA